MNLLLSIIVLASGLPYTPGAITAAGSVEISGNSTIDGLNMASNVPTNCPADRRAGITVRAGNSVTVNGSASVLGYPDVNTVDTDAFNKNYLLTQEQLDDLRNYAIAHGTYVVPTSSAMVNLTVVDGLIFVDTVNAVPVYLDSSPDLSVLANVKITNANNSGHIVVMGSVTLDGNITYSGLIYALNDLQYKGTGNGGVSGGLVSANIVPSMSTVIDTTALGNSKIYNDCEKVAFDCSVMLGVRRDDQYVPYVTANMPDSALNGISAPLYMLRTQPVHLPGCSAKKTMLLIHGASIDAVTVFDLQYQNMSFVQRMAELDITTYALDILGYGKSSMAVMENPCNASLPACCPTPVTGSTYLTCASTCQSLPSAGVSCDCRSRNTANVVPNQQGTACPGLTQTACQDTNNTNMQGCLWNGSACVARYLQPTDLIVNGQSCARTSKIHLINQPVITDNIDKAVDYVHAQSGQSVNLLGYSAGGTAVGPYLADSTRAAKIERVIFVSSNFPNPASEDPNVPTQPLGLADKAELLRNFNSAVTPGCPGVGVPPQSTIDAVWAVMKTQDATGPSWGSQPDGLNRYPRPSRWGWTASAAASISNPTLVLNGLRDVTVVAVTSVNLYNALTYPGIDKHLVQLSCASHGLFWEACSSSSCPYREVADHVSSWVLNGVP